MKKAYVSFLANDDFLPGVLVVHQSLREAKAAEELVVLVTPGVSAAARTCLGLLGVKVRPVAPIGNPNQGLQYARYGDCYSKLWAFGLVEYQKIVFLDADLLICDNLDCLFDKPGWSAVNAGGLLPEYRHWVELNSGVMVIEPDGQVFSDMLRRIETLPSKEGGDQGFLHAYFPAWPQRPALHLDHRYNVATDLLERYCRELPYHWPGPAADPGKTTIAVLHFWGPDKPWTGRAGAPTPKSTEAYQAWWACYGRARQALSRQSAGADLPAGLWPAVARQNGNHLHQPISIEYSSHENRNQPPGRKINQEPASGVCKTGKDRRGAQGMH
jgi:hypothetical protein